MTSESFYIDEHILKGLYKDDKSDIYPPNRITDLRIDDTLNLPSSTTISSSDQLQAALSWTAPGDDFNYGKAAFYEIRCYTRPQVLRDPVEFEQKAIPVPRNLLPLPLEAGALQKATVSLPWPNEVFYYAIVGVDDVGNRGMVSNLVPIFAAEVTTRVLNASMVFKVIETPVSYTHLTLPTNREV